VFGFTIFEDDEAVEVFQLRASRYADPAALDPIGRPTPIPKSQGMAGLAAQRRQSPSSWARAGGSTTTSTSCSTSSASMSSAGCDPLARQAGPYGLGIAWGAGLAHNPFSEVLLCTPDSLKHALRDAMGGPTHLQSVRGNSSGQPPVDVRGV
jgi:hypothetical protein